MIVTLTDTNNQAWVFSADFFAYAEHLRPRMSPGVHGRSVVTLKNGKSCEVLETVEQVFDRVRSEDPQPKPCGSTWVAIVHHPGAATTVSFPGVGEVLAVGDDKRRVAFGSYHAAIEHADLACEAYECVCEVARLDLILGVDGD